jgi:hypothetical protein
MQFFKKCFLILFLLSFLNPSFFAYEKVPVTIEFKGGGELHTSFYCFNDLAEGKSLAEEKFGIKNFESLVKGSKEKIMPVPLGTNVALYDWAIFFYGDEFWLFEVRGGYLYGRGRLVRFY